MNSLFYLMLLLLILPTLSYSAEVLVIGDSLSVGQASDDRANTRSGLGRELGKLLERDGHQVNVVASCGSSPMSYMSKYKSYKTRCGYYQKFSGEQKIDKASFDTPKLKDIVKSTKAPDLVVIQQGTNLYWAIHQGNAKYVEDKVVEPLKEYQELTSGKSPESKCLWIGPPAILKISGKVVTKDQADLMAKSIQAGITKSGIKCEYVDSRLKTNVSGLSNDGTHYRTGQIDEWIDHSYKMALKNVNKPNRRPSSRSKDDCGIIFSNSNEEFLNDIENVKNRL